MPRRTGFCRVRSIWMRQPDCQNKNKCEELLNAEGSALENGISALCVFDLNNLRRINNNLGAR